MERRYTSVAREEANNTSAISSPRKIPSEVGGTGNNELERTSEKPNLRQGGHTEPTGDICEKKGCRLAAYGRCQWRNPCRFPRRTGGCMQLYCELHGAHFDNFRKFQCCTDCHLDFLRARKSRHDCRIVLAILFVLMVIVTGIMAAIVLAVEPEISK